ncbi:MAG: formylglycine-generating enzyme family protein, partial [bacterium]
PGLMMERLMLLCNAGEFNSALKELAKLENTPNPDKDLFLYKSLALNSLGQYDQADEALNKYSTLKAGEFWNIDFYKWNEDSKSIPHDWEKIIRSPKSSELKTKQSDFLFDTNHTEGLALSDKFAIAANSQLYIPYDGLNVKLIYDDGIRVYLDEMIIFENWQINHAKPEIIKIDATEGFHQIRVEYFQNEGAFAIGWKPLVSKSRISPLYVNISKLILQNKFDEAISLIQLNSRNPQGLMTNNEVLSHSRCFALLAMAIKTSHPDTSDQFKQNAIDLIESNIINNDIENSFSFNDINTIQEFQWIFQDHDNAIFMKDNEVMDFWIASNEVTYDLFLLFNNDPDALPEEKADQWNDYDKRVTPAPETPAHHVNVFDTILFCNWLSRREGRKPCYRKSGNSVQFGQDHFHNEWLLDKKADGYRLPLEYEWELACRAGTMTEWSTGSNEELVKSYSHLNSNKPTLVSTPRVNPWGLANMHGNLWEWCYDKSGIDNFARGGSFNNDPINCRSTSRFINSPHFRSNSIGFRIVLNNPPQANPVKSPGNE